MHARSYKIPLYFAVIVNLFTASCSKHNSSSGNDTRRNYRMGFAASAPNPELNAILHSLSIWTMHADAAIISNEVPWDSLLDGKDPAMLVRNSYLQLAQVYRAANLRLWVYIDPENGLDRAHDSRLLSIRSKSIANPEVQKLYVAYACAMDSILHPDHLGLALETNLVRLAAPDSIYQGVRNGANVAASAIRAFDSHTPLSVSVQAEVSWSLLGTGTGYSGNAQDFIDFPFITELGISSYPYLVFKSPEDIPSDYYSRITSGKTLPVFVSESGWSSGALPALSISSSPAAQQNWVRKQGKLLQSANAIAWFQLAFTDLSLSAWPMADSANLYPFAFLGMVDSNFVAKPAFATWDSLRAIVLH